MRKSGEESQKYTLNLSEIQKHNYWLGILSWFCSRRSRWGAIIGSGITTNPYAIGAVSGGAGESVLAGIWGSDLAESLWGIISKSENNSL